MPYFTAILSTYLPFNLQNEVLWTEPKLLQEFSGPPVPSLLQKLLELTLEAQINMFDPWQSERLVPSPVALASLCALLDLAANEEVLKAMIEIPQFVTTLSNFLGAIYWQNEEPLVSPTPPTYFDAERRLSNVPLTRGGGAMVKISTPMREAALELLTIMFNQEKFLIHLMEKPDFIEIIIPLLTQLKALLSNDLIKDIKTLYISKTAIKTFLLHAAQNEWHRRTLPSINPDMIKLYPSLPSRLNALIILGKIAFADRQSMDEVTRQSFEVIQKNNLYFLKKYIDESLVIPLALQSLDSHTSCEFCMICSRSNEKYYGHSESMKENLTLAQTALEIMARGVGKDITKPLLTPYRVPLYADAFSARTAFQWSASNNMEQHLASLSLDLNGSLLNDFPLIYQGLRDKYSQIQGELKALKALYLNDDKMELGVKDMETRSEIIRHEDILNALVGQITDAGLQAVTRKSVEAFIKKRRSMIPDRTVETPEAQKITMADYLFSFLCINRKERANRCYQRDMMKMAIRCLGKSKDMAFKHLDTQLKRLKAQEDLEPAHTALTKFIFDEFMNSHLECEDETCLDTKLQAIMLYHQFLHHFKGFNPTKAQIEKVFPAVQFFLEAWPASEETLESAKETLEMMIERLEKQDAHLLSKANLLYADMLLTLMRTQFKALQEASLKNEAQSKALSSLLHTAIKFRTELDFLWCLDHPRPEGPTEAVESRASVLVPSEVVPPLTPEETMKIALLLKPLIKIQDFSLGGFEAIGERSKAEQRLRTVVQNYDPSLHGTQTYHALILILLGRELTNFAFQLNPGFSTVVKADYDRALQMLRNTAEHFEDLLERAHINLEREAEAIRAMNSPLQSELNFSEIDEEEAQASKEADEEAGGLRRSKRIRQKNREHEELPQQKRRRVTNATFQPLEPGVDIRTIAKDSAWDAWLIMIARDSAISEQLSWIGSVNDIFTKLSSLLVDPRSPQNQRFAAIALSNLATVAENQKAIGQIAGMFNQLHILLRTPHLGLKKAVLRLLLNLAALPEHRQAIFATEGILEVLLSFCMPPSENTLCRAALMVLVNLTLKDTQLLQDRAHERRQLMVILGGLKTRLSDEQMLGYVDRILKNTEEPLEENLSSRKESAISSLSFFSPPLLQQRLQGVLLKLFNSFGFSKEDFFNSLTSSGSDDMASDDRGSFFIPANPLHIAASDFGFQIHNVRGDGNCFFHAVNHQLTARQIILQGDISHLSLRQRAYDYMLAHPDTFNGFMDDDAIAQLSSQARAGTWADHPIISALAQSLGLEIRILRSNGQVNAINPGGGQNGVIAIGYNTESMHYVSLVGGDPLSLQFAATFTQ